MNGDKYVIVLVKKFSLLVLRQMARLNSIGLVVMLQMWMVYVLVTGCGDSRVLNVLVTRPAGCYISC